MKGLLHELVHSTGHPSRLDRFAQENNYHKFGSEVYAQEELVAEIGAGFLCSEVGSETRRIAIVPLPRCGRLNFDVRE